MRLYIRAKYREGIRFKEKLRLFSTVIIIGFTVLFARLAYLQVIAGGQFKRLSDENRIRLLPLKAPRGIVYDRAGVPLIDNRPSFRVSIIPAEADDPVGVLDRLAHFLKLDREFVIKQIDKFRRSPFRQVVVAQDVSIEEAGAIEEYSLKLPGVIIAVEPRRRFPLGEAGAQLLGYPAQISPDELDRLFVQGYRMGELIGKSGVERVAEEWLRGMDGGMQVQVYANARPQVELDAFGNPSVRIDTAGHKLLTLGKKAPRAGDTVTLTIDAEMQRIAMEEMKGRNGAVVILDAGSGAVRAMVSTPSYDPNIFVSGGTDSQRIDVLSDSQHPMLNRAIKAYPPGSTFKIVMAYAALAGGVIGSDTRYTCTGSYMLGRRFRCWKDEGHGSLDLIEALAYSCDVYFYNVGLELGIDRISAYAALFGFGETTGVELMGESRGIVPSRQWKKDNFRKASDKKWYDGETLNAAIGQGYILTTPLQLARAYATVVNGGNLMRPYIIHSVSMPESDALVMTRGPSLDAVLEDTRALGIVKEGLRQAVYSRSPFSGTARAAINDVVPLIGKTGTAQVAAFTDRAETDEDLQKIPYKQRDHAWFIAVTQSAGTDVDQIAEADAEDEIDGPLVIAVLCEHAGHASRSAVIVAREIAKRIAARGEAKKRPAVAVDLRSGGGSG